MIASSYIKINNKSISLSTLPSMTGSTPVAMFNAWNIFMSNALDFLQADKAKTAGMTLDAHIHSQSWGYIIMIHFII